MIPGENLQTGKCDITQLNILLNSWPEGTVGHESDIILIKLLDELGKKYGYGFLSQMAGWIADIQSYQKPQAAVDLKRERFGLLGWKLPDNFEQVAKEVSESE